MNEPIRPRAHGCKCDGSGLLGSTGLRCLCMDESADGALARVIEEKQELVRTVDELSLVVVDLERERDLLRAQVATLRAHRLRLIDVLSEEAARLQAAQNLPRARALMAVVREVADG